MRPIDAPTAIPIIVVLERVFDVGRVVEFVAVEGVSIVLAAPVSDVDEVAVVLVFEQKSW